MAWVYLFIAGIFETVWAASMKYTEGFTKLWPSLVTIGAMLISVSLLSVALKTIPIGMGYAVWTGIGAAGTVVIGILLFKEPVQMFRIICLVLIIAGIIGLKFTSEH